MSGHLAAWAILGAYVAFVAGGTWLVVWMTRCRRRP